VHQCIALYPAGKDKYLAFENCNYCSYCKAACGTDEYCTALNDFPDGGAGAAGAAGSDGGAGASGAAGAGGAAGAAGGAAGTAGAGGSAGQDAAAKPTDQHG
jgi:hypothetical protein